MLPKDKDGFLYLTRKSNTPCAATWSRKSTWTQAETSSYYTRMQSATGRRGIGKNGQLRGFLRDKFIKIKNVKQKERRRRLKGMEWWVAL